MAGPWEDYAQSANGPWADYAAPQPSVGQDVLKGGGVGLAQGAIGLAGLPGDVRELMAKGVNLGSQLIGHELPQETVSGALRHVPMLGSPTSEQLQSGIEQATGPFYQAQTLPGKIAQTAGQFAPAVIGGPESIATKLATRVAAPALATTAVEQMGGGAIPQTAAAIASSALAHRAITPTVAPLTRTADVEAAANQIYKNVENSTVGVPLQNRDAFVTDLKDTLNKAAKREASVPDVHAQIDKLPAKADVADLVILQKNLTPLTGREGVAARIAIQKVEQEIERQVPGMGAQLREADQNWNAFKTAQGLDKRATKIELQTSGTHSGTNLGNKIRQSATAAATGPQSRFMRPDEITALENVARGTFSQNRLRDVGNLIGGGVGLGGLVAGEILGGHEGGTLGGVGTVLAGRALRGAYNRSVAQQAARVGQQVLARSPEGMRRAAIAARYPIPAGTPAGAVGLLTGVLGARPRRGLLGDLGGS